MKIKHFIFRCKLLSSNENVQLALHSHVVHNLQFKRVFLNPAIVHISCPKRKFI